MADGRKFTVTEEVTRSWIVTLADADGSDGQLEMRARDAIDGLGDADVKLLSGSRIRVAMLT